MPESSNMSLTPPPSERAAPHRALRNGQPVSPREMPLQRAARGETVSADEVDFVLEDGTLLRTLVSARPLFGTNGETRGAVERLQAFADAGLQRLNEALHAMRHREVGTRRLAQARHAFAVVEHGEGWTAGWTRVVATQRTPGAYEGVNLTPS